MSDLRKKLQTEIEECDWNLLDKNLERGAVILVESSLDLVDVGVAIAEDQTQTVANWLNDRKLLNISMEDAETYKDSKFQFLIIQPYVLVQTIN